MFAIKPPQTICSRCLARRFLSTSPSHSSSSSPLPKAPPLPSGFANLKNRRLIVLHGSDAPHFLQGLTTANIPSIKSKDALFYPPGFFSAFLNAQGRVLHDVFIYPSGQSPAYWKSALGGNGDTTEGFFIEVDAGGVDKLVRWLKRYKLRAKVTIRKLKEGEWNIFSVWGPNKPPFVPPPTTLQPIRGAGTLLEDIISIPDTRSPTFSGQRILLPDGSKLPDIIAATAPEEEEFSEASLEQYTLRRYLHGIPEGLAEIISEHALPQESNVDYMLGVDFRKGCYVGQELTIRTHHTGVVRKRILPVRLYRGSEGEDRVNVPERLEYNVQEAEALQGWGKSEGQGNVSRIGTKGRSAGKFLSRVGNVGLALCRLEQMVGEGSQETEFRVSWDGEEGLAGGKDVRVKAFLPDWFAQREAAVGLKKV
ncbi:MAG: ccr4 associated factor [Icmadophila ericetorum]|nr:ccr4 associated factor [Icmadophila ericetorum]